jgi:hypothetical protein
MSRHSSLALVCALVCANLAFAQGAREEVANGALDVISSRYPTPHDNYMVVICKSDRAAALANDTALGAFVRYMRVVKSTTAVVVAPVGYSSDPTYVVYLDGTKPLGLAALDASADRADDAAVAKAYSPVTGPIEKRKRVPVYKAISIPLDEGGIEALQIVGWK